MSRPSRYAPNTADRPPHWSDDAECREHPYPDLWFTEPDGDPTAVVEAKSVCGRCQVQVECGHGALDRREPHGIWGGMDFTERKELIETAAAAAEKGGGASDVPAEAAD